MKTLMTRVKDRLSSEVAAIRGRDIFFTPDHDMIPDTVKIPCIGVKDGKVTRTDLSGGAVEAALALEISVYARLFLDNKAIPDLMEICDAIREALKDDYLGDYVQEVSCGNETPVQWIYERDVLLIRKTLFFQYIKEE